jgi:hypothetical protein
VIEGSVARGALVHTDEYDVYARLDEYLVRKAGRPSPDDECYAGAGCRMRSGNQGTASASGILRRAPR